MTERDALQAAMTAITDRAAALADDLVAGETHVDLMWRLGVELGDETLPENREQIIRGMLSRVSFTEVLTLVALLRLDCARRADSRVLVDHACPWCGTPRGPATRSAPPLQRG